MLGVCLLLATSSNRAAACAPCFRDSGKPVVNADQTVIILWDAAKKTEHFIRKASFKSDADDFGFLIGRIGERGVSVFANADRTEDDNDAATEQWRRLPYRMRGGLRSEL
jgi:hypothetical protein